MTEVLSKVQVSTSTIENSTAPIGIKLNGSNYALWSQVVEMYISDKEKLGYINDNCPPPPQTYPSFRKWRIDNVIVKGCDVLQMSPFPSIDQAYAHVHIEALQQAVMSTSDPDNTSGVVLITKGLKLSSTNTNSIAVSSHGKSTTAFKSQTVPDGMKCPHCGNQCHTSENCLKKKMVILIGGMSCRQRKRRTQLVLMRTRLLDSGATNHMTFAATDFTTTSPPQHTSVANANGVDSLITRDILTKEIIGHGTKRGGGLYYMEDVSTAKSHRTSYALSMNKNTLPFALVHFDVWGPSPISIGYGVRCLCTSSQNQRTKLDPCARRYLFLGYVVHQKSYRCYDLFIRRTYVTIDVTFLESEPFFPAPTSSLQGETQDEEQKWLHFDWPNSEIVVDEAPSLISIDPTRLDGPTEHNTTSENYTPSLTEPSSPLSLVHADPSLENIFEVSILDTSSNRSDLNTSTGYTLPFKENHGKPPTKYSSDIEK
ncbi:hypothetical protein CK203_017997 [Vitis vinifera]|uniref:Uncharacterized protein n=1 Tax=Vitis vinifera TaxID=29760 RepID=A0A438JWK4_VITVI|nr:hypothetical protein CK203_017997 [Vitis vinifera]